VSTPGEQRFRAEVKDWITRSLPAGWRQAMTGVEETGFLRFQREWFATVASAGYATPHWSAEWPGGGRSLAEQVILFEELARADAPRLVLHFVSLYHAAVTIEHWGTAEQKRRHLPAILQGTVWCQGFSEPNAGSDLASLRTRAVRNGDRYVVNGQKLWSTMGQHADWCLLLARTSSEGPKQAGLTYLLLDMKSKGVAARPLRQITSDKEFSELFFEDVEIPVENRLGGENEGWQVAQTTLASERGLTAVELAERMHWSLWRLLASLEQGGRLEDRQFQREAAAAQVKIEALRALIASCMARAAAGRPLAGDSSLVKLFFAEVMREFSQLGLRAQGLAGQYASPLVLGGGFETGNWMADFFNSYQWSIAGGSNEVQRNIIAERVLGMPREKSW
jgi:alkylation response protein AidB-like acyl-CoA dehydrogenase